jgi:hypothetical protein
MMFRGKMVELLIKSMPASSDRLLRAAARRRRMEPDERADEMLTGVLYYGSIHATIGAMALPRNSEEQNRTAYYGEQRRGGRRRTARPAIRRYQGAKRCGHCLR